MTLALDLMLYAALAVVVLVGAVFLFVGGWALRRMEEDWRQAQEERNV